MNQEIGRSSFLDDWKLPFAVVIVIALVFGGYEVAERLWLPDADPALLHRLHLLRGMG